MLEWLRPIATYVLYAAFAGCVFHFALESQTETRRLLGERRRIRAEIAQLTRQNEWREKVREALTSDPFYVERILRQRFGYRRAGEEEPAGLARIARSPEAQTDARSRSRPAAGSVSADTRVSSRPVRRGVTQ